ncbi:hypothetical protein C5O80_32120 [Burkholderia sp. SRS-46]|nr:hypothetical protein C5O80_32120 [Burkholderia sp. SRS-46]
MARAAAATRRNDGQIRARIYLSVVLRKRWSGFGDFARKAPYFSGALILLVGLFVGYQGVVVLS